MSSFTSRKSVFRHTPPRLGSHRYQSTERRICRTCASVAVPDRIVKTCPVSIMRTGLSVPPST